MNLNLEKPLNNIFRTTDEKQEQGRLIWQLIF